MDFKVEISYDPRTAVIYERNELRFFTMTGMVAIKDPCGELLEQLVRTFGTGPVADALDKIVNEQWKVCEQG